MVASALGALIRDMRTARGWSQTQLAAFLNTESGSPTLTHNDVSRWENGRQR
ncbi:MAG: helix-turn-helix transcriptional regulator [Geodermatophilaceae bacterium]|nr:helix-turn-helix transcriptional regulator [Geodermatophilaceae bacterium]